MNTRQLGSKKEQLAADYLQENGYNIVCCNYRCRQAEIDIIAQKEEYLIFVEVKYRKDKQCGGSLYAVSREKQKKICYAAKHYIYERRIPLDQAMRFDVIAIDGNEIMHIKNAFETC
ncbi:MAG: YraN family protein [Eubacterium sp.]